MLRSQALYQLDTVGIIFYYTVENDLLVTVGLVASLRAACGTNVALPILVRHIGYSRASNV